MPEAAGESVYEADAGATCPHSEVDLLASWRDKPVDDGLSVGTVVDGSVEVYLSVVVVPVGTHFECAHGSLLEEKVVDGDVGPCLW